MAKRGMEITDKGSTPSIKIRKNHLLLIGIDEYSNGIRRLSNAVKDAQSFRDVLLKNYQFEKENIVELIDINANQDNITAQLRKLGKTLTKDDNLIIYFAGHGLYDDFFNEGYWIPYGARLNKNNDYIDNNEIIKVLKAIRAHHVLCIVDACFSEAIFRSGRSLEEAAANRVEKYKSRWAISAGRLEPVDDGSPGSNSPFTESLVAMLEDETDNLLWVSDIANHLTKIVSDNADQTPRGQAIPGVGDQGGQFIFRKKGFVENVDKKTDTIANVPTRNTPDNAPPPQSQPVDNSPVDVPTEQPATLPEWRIQMKELITLDMKQAMVSLNGGINRSGSKYNDLILLRARLNSAGTDAKRGVVTTGQTNMINNQIRYALIEMVDDISENDLKRLYIQRD